MREKSSSSAGVVLNDYIRILLTGSHSKSKHSLFQLLLDPLHHRLHLNSFRFGAKLMLK